MATCERCHEREGTGDREGLLPREVLDAVEQFGKTLSFFTCEVCETPWTLVEEIGTGRPAVLIRGLFPNL